MRAAVFEGRGAGWRHGWAVLARAGMAAWARAVAGLVPAARRQEPAPAGRAPAPPDTQVADELVHALAAIVLARLVPP